MGSLNMLLIRIDFRENRDNQFDSTVGGPRTLFPGLLSGTLGASCMPGRTWLPSEETLGSLVRPRWDRTPPPRSGAGPRKLPPAFSLPAAGGGG